MKRFILFSVFLSTITMSFANEYTLYSTKAKQFENIQRSFCSTIFEIRYDDEEDMFFIYTIDSLTMITSWIYFTKEDLAQLRTLCSKFFEWERIATENELMVEKLFPGGQFDTKIVWSYADNSWYESTCLLNTIFFSQNETEHQMVFATNKIKDINDDITQFEIRGIYLDKQGVKDLYDALDETKIEKMLMDFASQKELIEKLFI